MKRVLVIGYWVVSILLVATILSSLGYKFPEAVFIGTLFLPGALAAKFFLLRISFSDRWSGINDAIFLVLGILVMEMLFFMLAHFSISIFRGKMVPYQLEDVPHILTNPVFIALILTALALGNHFFESWLEKKQPEEPGPITFTSERKPVSLPIEDILYVESNDSITTVVAADGRHFKNKTPISQWEATLSPFFIRIHRSYLVNKSAVSHIDVDILYVGDAELPISRKYKEEVAGQFPSKASK